MAEQIVTKGYKPEKVLAYFEELCKIPHGSGNEEAVAKYIENFAKEINAEHFTGAMENVASQLLPTLKSGNIIIGLGAGTITTLGKYLKG